MMKQNLKDICLLKGWKRPYLLAPNIYKEFSDFKVSYNFIEDETALIVKYRGDERFFILDGDLCEIYEGLSLKEALQKFIKYSHKRLNYWSNTVEEAKRLYRIVKNNK